MPTARSSTSFLVLELPSALFPISVPLLILAPDTSQMCYCRVDTALSRGQFPGW